MAWEFVEILRLDLCTFAASEDRLELIPRHFFLQLLVDGLDHAQNRQHLWRHVCGHGFTAFLTCITALCTGLLVEALVEVLEDLNTATF